MQIVLGSLALCEQEKSAEGKERLTVLLGRVGDGHAFGESVDELRGFLFG